MEAGEAFYNDPTYQGLKHIRDACSSARLVSVVELQNHLILGRSYVMTARFSKFVLSVLAFIPAMPTFDATAQTSTASSPSTYPGWAYPWAPDFVVAHADDVPQRLPGSAASVSWKQARNLFFAPDWFPGEHGPMPDVVKSGRMPDVRACGSCHRATGTGGPENASLGGLSVEYFKQQIDNFKSGGRGFSGPRRSAVLLMIAAAKAMTDTEVQAAADYFAALKPSPIIRVVEDYAVPKTYIARLFFAKSPEGGVEPLGQRIVEVPDDVEQFELRDPRAQFTAYVPPGSIAKGQALVRTGGSGKTAQCEQCHGPELKGVGPIPGIAGRSPTYIVRQLFDFKEGVRTSESAALMRLTVKNLSVGEMISIAAYLGSLKP